MQVPHPTLILHNHSKGHFIGVLDDIQSGTMNYGEHHLRSPCIIYLNIIYIIIYI